jgi:hypothetical protein
MSAQGPPEGIPNEEELRAAYEAELARITATDMIAQAAVSLLNIGARRIGPPAPPPGSPPSEQPPGAGERDLDQVRDAIDASMALLEILGRRLPAEQLAPLRDAVSRLQMAYAAEVGSAGGPEGAAGAQGAPEGPGGEGGSGGSGEAGGSGGGEGGKEPPAGTGQSGSGEEHRPGPAESSGRLWVPGR